MATDVSEVAGQLAAAGAHDVYVLPPGQGADLLAARESAFWMVKAAGADDVIDMVVPRDRIPEYLREVQGIAEQRSSKVFGCGHAGDGNIHFSVYEPDDEAALRVARCDLPHGDGDGWSDLRGAWHRANQEGPLPTARGPGQAALQRRIKAAFDPAGILNPGCIFDMAGPEVP